MIETVKDLQGREVTVGNLPGVGTKLLINGNSFRVVYKRETPRISYTIELIKRYEPEIKNS